MEVLELATGPGLIAKQVAPSTSRMVAADYSEGMIREAEKGVCPDNLSFEVDKKRTFYRPKFQIILMIAVEISKYDPNFNIA